MEDPLESCSNDPLLHAPTSMSFSDFAVAANSGTAVSTSVIKLSINSFAWMFEH